MQLRPALEAVGQVEYATTDPQLAVLAGVIHHKIADYSQSEPMKVLAGAWEAFWLVRRIRPDVVVSTGAAPGLLCLFWGHVTGARTIWIDSVANAECLSLSGRLASRFATVALTQWEALAAASGPEYAGSVL